MSRHKYIVTASAVKQAWYIVKQASAELSLVMVLKALVGNFDKAKLSSIKLWWAWTPFTWTLFEAMSGQCMGGKKRWKIYRHLFVVNSLAWVYNKSFGNFSIAPFMHNF